MARLGIEQKCADRLRTGRPREVECVTVIAFQVTLDERGLVDHGGSAAGDVLCKLLDPRIEVLGKLEVFWADLWRDYFVLFRNGNSARPIWNFRQYLVLDAAQRLESRVDGLVVIHFQALLEPPKRSGSGMVRKGSSLPAARAEFVPKWGARGWTGRILILRHRAIAESGIACDRSCTNCGRRTHRAQMPRHFKTANGVPLICLACITTAELSFTWPMSPN